MYSCKSCNCHLYLICGGDPTLKLLSSKSPEERKRMMLKDISHPHQLKLLRIQNHQEDYVDGDEDKGEDEDDDVAHNVSKNLCKACLQPIVDSSYYICSGEYDGCKDYTLHRFCAELPIDMKHWLHPLHPLVLMLSPPPDHFKCFACGKLCRGHIYSCRLCSFQLDIVCATTVSRVLEHKCHQHPLTLLPLSNSSIFCAACCKVHKGMFYQCTTCVVFFIHERCASLEYIMYHESHKGHPLRLGYHSDGSNKCYICYKKIFDGTGWFYYCLECKFYIHLKCKEAENARKIVKIDKDITCLPWEEADDEFGIVGLSNRDVRNTQNEKYMINHFSHPKHPLILQLDVPREANPYSDGEIILKTECHGCCKQISDPLYSCTNCQFYIHKGCALLPTSVDQHHGHSEHAKCKLVLVNEPWCETRSFECGDCLEYCNGFCYQCEEEFCNYKIDVECAFLPKKIVHKAHPFHPLTLVEFEPSDEEKDMFKCCLLPNISRYVYGCDSCKFMIDTQCAMYPAKAHHRFDHKDPFILCFNPSNIKPNEYHYCEICETKLDPKKWFYFSSKFGGQIMHPRCLLFRDSVDVTKPNFKSISSFLRSEIHPHPLHLYPLFTLKKCCHCQMTINDHKNNTANKVEQQIHFVYQCVVWNCEYRIHISCANRFLQAKEITQQNVDTGIGTLAYNIQQLFLEGSPDTLGTSKGKEILEQ